MMNFMYEFFNSYQVSVSEYAASFPVFLTCSKILQQHEMARSVANLHKSHEEIEQQNLTSSPLMRNSYNEGANSSKQNQS